MPAKESLHKFDLPEEVLEVLPSDPFEQLDVARKITSIALSTRVSTLQSESSFLITKLSDKDAIIDDLQNQINSLDSSLSDTADKLSLALRQKERLKKENASLSAAVNKLNRDVAKLENFRQTLMRSLQDDDAYPGGAQLVAATDEEEIKEERSKERIFFPFFLCLTKRSIQFPRKNKMVQDNQIARCVRLRKKGFISQEDEDEATSSNSKYSAKMQKETLGTGDSSTKALGNQNKKT